MKAQSLAFAAALACSAPAFADSVLIDDFVFTPAMPLSVGSPSYSGPAGQFKGLLNGNSFVTYCTDLSQTFQFDVLYTDYTVVGGAAVWGPSKSLVMDKLMSAAIASAVPANSAQSAAVQAAVWEVLYETSGTYDLTAGTFTATSSDGTTNTLLGSVNWAGIMADPVTYHVDQLYSRSHRDFMVITQVPEPGTYALFAAGLAGIAFVARRRTRQT